MRTLAAGRVAHTGAWANDGPFRDAGAWMPSVAGTSVGRAKATMETAERLASLPETEAALPAGSLSEVQVDAITAAAAADPRAERMLLESAGTDGVRGLKNACARVEAAASTDQAERYETARVKRSFKHRAISDVEGCIEMRGPIDATAAVMAALEPIEADLFEEARAASKEPREDPHTRAFDALHRMADSSAAAALVANGRKAPPTIVFRIDHTAFVRGHTVPGEICEVVGIGPVPVSVVQRLANDAIFKALITDRTDIRGISHLSRVIPVRMRTGLEDLQPECVISGCHVSRHLEIDHNIPVEEQGPTALWNLNRLCHHHHRVKTTQKLRVEGEGVNKRLVAGPQPPPDP